VAEFRRLALASSDATVIEELEQLVWRYIERAKEMEAAASTRRGTGAKAEQAPS
jgi:hypothetical protein